MSEGLADRLIYLIPVEGYFSQRDEHEVNAASLDRQTSPKTPYRRTPSGA